MDAVTRVRKEEDSSQLSHLLSSIMDLISTQIIPPATDDEDGSSLLEMKSKQSVHRIFFSKCMY